jgi:hypothetical protein
LKVLVLDEADRMLEMGFEDYIRARMQRDPVRVTVDHEMAADLSRVPGFLLTLFATLSSGQAASEAHQSAPF